MSTFNPYLLMSLFYFSLAVIATFGSALVSAEVVSTVGSMRWFQVHFITLGMFTQAVLGVLPGAVAGRAGLRAPRTRWDIWLVLNAGLLALLVAVPLVDRPMMVAGGSLVMIAIALVAWQLIRLHRGASAPPSRPVAGARAVWSYGAALGFLLLGAFIGTGLWLGWSRWLHLPAPKEVHVHSMLWGFGSLLLARFLVQLVQVPEDEQRGWQRSVTATFWLMFAGALGLTLGPWLESGPLQAAGLAAHTAGTLWLLIQWVRGQRRARAFALPSALHLVTAYFWQMVTVVAAPLVVFMPDGVIARQVATQGGPILVYGWLLQYSYALIPFLFSVTLQPDRRPTLGGSWLGLVAGHAGTALYVAGLLAADVRPALHTAGYALWAISAMPVVVALWRLLQTSLESRPQHAADTQGRAGESVEGAPTRG